MSWRLAPALEVLLVRSFIRFCRGVCYGPGYRYARCSLGYSGGLEVHCREETVMMLRVVGLPLRPHMHNTSI